MATLPIVGFLGAGQMATALAKGWVSAQLIDSTKSLASDPFAAAREKFASVTKLATTPSNIDVVTASQIVMLSVKPQTMPAILAEIRSYLAPHQLVVSIAAGITLRQLADTLGTDVRMIRVMPNTPCLVGASAAGIAASPAATADDVAIVQSLFTAVGKAFTVAEHLLDAVTGLSGSGPAFVYVMIEALADGGVRAGLPRDVALTLAAQTVLGSAKMVLETGTHPGALKDAVASPGGTTIAGLHALENRGFRGAVMDAVVAAAKRATELGTNDSR